MKKLPVASDLAVAEAKTAVQQQPPMVKKQPRRPMTSRYPCQRAPQPWGMQPRGEERTTPASCDLATAEPEGSAGVALLHGWFSMAYVVYASQTLKFVAPVYVGDEVVARVQALNIIRTTGATNCSTTSRYVYAPAPRLNCTPQCNLT